ncbi:glycosyltransferase [Amorphoplanes nipponensis]|uniref:Glycosyl transferase n=1 Tax=Actinoplanes nipponensis TaxID=135950 RepID=A0A919JR37_9ACTN|nr:glycosyltransferase [Actinoplanes nipponensis]GIE51414.1 glycosyl transferase [Actinoplanes nipponensis]
MSGPEQAPVTVVVATRNRRDRLLETIPRHEGPVILVDNGSDDGGPEAVEAAFPQVTVVRLGENRGAAARNVGVELARTPYVAFADDDSYWAPGALGGAAALLRDHPRVGLLSARVLVGQQGRLDPVSAAMAAAPLGVPAGAPGPAVLGFLACAVTVRREAFRQVGGFNPQLHVYGEEALLAMDLAAAGWLQAYAPQLVVRHLPLPAGRDNGARHRIEARNRVLTALLRRPPAVVARTTMAAWRDDRRGVADAARLLPWALRQRRPLPDTVENDLRTLTSR